MPYRPIDAIHFPVAVDAGLGTIASERDYERHVVQLIKQVLFTAPGERVNRPEFGCGVRQMVFAANGEVTASLVRVTIQQALSRWLAGVIEVQDIEVTAVEETLEIRIGYVLLSNREQRWLNVEVAV